MSLKKFKHYLIQEGQNETLSRVSASPRGDLPQSKSEALAELNDLHLRLGDLQQRFHVDRRHKLLIVLQGMDTSGKGGTIKHVFRGVNPQGVHVAGFEKPTTREAAHDFLWRVHQHTPANGEIMIFDRSHYEDVLAVRVNKLKPESVWEKRYRHINDFEQLLVDEDTIILKFSCISIELLKKNVCKNVWIYPLRTGNSILLTSLPAQNGTTMNRPTRKCSTRHAIRTLHGISFPPIRNGRVTY